MLTLKFTQIIQAVLGRRIPLASSERIDVPDAVSRIIQKMCQKQIDDRYHSTSGVKHDFIEVRRLLGEGDSEGLSTFQIGLKDVPSFFVLPTTITGRDKERQMIVDIVERTAQWQEKQSTGVGSNPLFGSTSGTSTLSDRFDNGEYVTKSSDTSSQVIISPPLGPSSSGRSAAQGSQTNSQENSNGATTANKPPLEVHHSKESVDTAYSYDTAPKSSHRLEYSVSGLLTGANQSKRPRGSHRKMRRHRCEVILITGAAGAGKSSLIQSTQAQIRKWGYFASTKFDPALKAPFEPLLRAMSSLFRQIFSESDVNSGYHNMIRKNIRGIWASVYSLLDLPENLMSTETQYTDKPVTSTSQGFNKSLKAEMMDTNSARSTQSGNMEPATHVTYDAREVNSRSPKVFNIFLDVLRILSSRLICLCLDDINYADEESLELISNILSRKLGIVILTTCRDQGSIPENVEHTLKNAASNFTSIRLAPLSEEEVVKYVAATLYRPVEYILSLAMVCLEKSNGNPFYLKQMLETCHRKSCIWYSWKESVWDFDLDRVFVEFESETYGEQLNTNFITKRLQDLPTAARAILAWASLLGNTFSFQLIQRLLSGEFDYIDNTQGNDKDDCTTVTTVFTPQPVKNVVEGLQSTLQANILVPGSNEDEFSFSHDRYVSASASLRECSDSEKMHYIITQVIMKYSSLDRRSLFVQAQHVCKAAEVIRRRDRTRYKYREYLFNAAQRAIGSGARPTALQYYETCLAFLQPDPWREGTPDVFYDESIILFNKTAELYWHQGQPVAAQNLLDSIFAGARSASDKSSAWILQSKLFAQSGNIQGAFSALKTSLLELGLDVSATPTWDSCNRDYIHLSKQLRTASFKDIISKPLSTDNKVVAMGSVLIEAVSAGFWSNSTMVCHAPYPSGYV